MFVEKLDIIIAILASLAVALVSVMKGAGLSELAYRLVITILVFFTIGFIIKIYLKVSVLKKTAHNEEDAESYETDKELQAEEDYEGK